jgi:ABC-type phosphate transport system permease subunit
LIGGTVLFADSLGLDAVGWSALGVELAMALVLLPTVVRWLRPKASTA